MDYRERRREQARHRKLGTFILIVSGIVGVVASGFFAFTLPIQIPFLPFVLGCVVAAGIYATLKKAVGYDRRKASSQYLKGESPDGDALPSRLIPEAPVFEDDSENSTEPPRVEERRGSSPAIVACSHCGMKVVPKPDGRCPSCQSNISESREYG